MMKDIRFTVSVFWISISAFLGPMQRITFAPTSQNVASGIFSNEVPKSDAPSLSETLKENGQIPKGEKLLDESYS